MISLSNITVTKIESLVTVSSRQGESWIMKKRQTNGLSFCVEGQITYLQNGKKYVSDKNVAILLPEGASYSLHRDKRGAFPLVNFYTAEPICDKITVFPITDAAEYISEVENMQKLSLFPENRAKVMSIFYGILHRIAMQQTATFSVIDPIVKYLGERYCDSELTNTELAARYGISEVYLRKLFLEKYGTTPHRYILALRIERAKQLLADGVLSVSKISEECGFSSLYHFSRSFKSRVGITPSEYMSKNRAEII